MNKISKEQKSNLAKLLATENINVIHQKVEFLGKKQIELNGNKYETLHFKFLSSDDTLPDNKKLNTDIWYDAKTFIWLKAQFVKQGNWEYRLKKVN